MHVCTGRNFGHRVASCFSWRRRHSIVAGAADKMNDLQLRLSVFVTLLIISFTLSSAAASRLKLEDDDKSNSNGNGNGDLLNHITGGYNETRVKELEKRLGKRA
jgi:hypothetical protein